MAGIMVISEDLLRALNLERACSQVLAEERQGQDLVPDPLHFLDFESASRQIVDELARGLTDGSFRAQRLIRMGVPKNNFCIRPAARPCLKDWVVYHAITNYLGIKADSKLLPCVYSMRLNPKTGTLEHGTVQWRRFEEAFWADFDKEPR